MTDHDKPVFAGVMARLALALRDKDPDSAQMRTYFEALKDLEVDFLSAAADRLVRTAEWFPKTSEWRAAAVAIERERTDDLTARLRSLPMRLCLVCDDTGWAPAAENRVKRCDCQTLRRLEILGRRPMPQLPEHVS